MESLWGFRKDRSPLLQKRQFYTFFSDLRKESCPLFGILHFAFIKCNLRPDIRRYPVSFIVLAYTHKKSYL